MLPVKSSIDCFGNFDFELGIGINSKVDNSIGIISCTIRIYIIFRMSISMGISSGVLVPILELLSVVILPFILMIMLLFI